MSRFSQIFIGVQFTGKIGQYLPEGECVAKPVFLVPVLGDQMAIDVPCKSQIVQTIPFHFIQIDTVSSFQNT